MLPCCRPFLGKDKEMAKKINYKPKTLKKRNEKNKIHPLGIKLTELFVEALNSNPPLPNTAWCIDLACTAIGWELVAAAEGNPELFVQNKIRQKIERDKGVRIRG